MSKKKPNDNGYNKGIRFYVLSADILRFRRDAFLFVLVLLICLFYVTFSLNIINFYTFLVLSLIFIFFFFISYFTPKHKIKIRISISKHGIRAGIIHYKWRYFNSFSVLKSNKKYYFFFKGFLFDSLFPIVIPVNKKDYMKVFHSARKHLIYEEV